MDWASLREGRVVRLWIAALGEEAVYEADLPVCCQRTAGSTGDSFECLSCGAMWQAPLPVEPERDAFMQQGLDREQKGAA